MRLVKVLLVVNNVDLVLLKFRINIPVLYFVIMHKASKGVIIKNNECRIAL